MNLGSFGCNRPSSLSSLLAPPVHHARDATVHQAFQAHVAFPPCQLQPRTRGPKGFKVQGISLKTLKALSALVEGEQLAQLHLHQLHQLLVLHRVDLVQETHHAGHAHLAARRLPSAPSACRSVPIPNLSATPPGSLLSPVASQGAHTDAEASICRCCPAHAFISSGLYLRDMLLQVCNTA